MSSGFMNAAAQVRIPSRLREIEARITPPSASSTTTAASSRADDVGTFAGALARAQTASSPTVTGIVDWALQNLYRQPPAIRRIVPQSPAIPSARSSSEAGPSGGQILSRNTSGSTKAELWPLFRAAGERYGVDPNLLAAVAQVESGFNTNAVSAAGAQGLMQFMPATASGLGIDPFDAAQAIDGGARYLATQLERFGSVELALAAYNAGPNAVARYGGVPPYAETTAYVSKVLGVLSGGSR